MRHCFYELPGAADVACWLLRNNTLANSNTLVHFVKKRPGNVYLRTALTGMAGISGTPTTFSHTEPHEINQIASVPV